MSQEKLEMFLDNFKTFVKQIKGFPQETCTTKDIAHEECGDIYSVEDLLHTLGLEYSIIDEFKKEGKEYIINDIQKAIALFHSARLLKRVNDGDNTFEEMADCVLDIANSMLAEVGKQLLLGVLKEGKS